MRGDCIYINKKRTDHWLTGINTSARTHSGPLVVDSFNLSNIIVDETDLGKLKKDNPTHYSIRISIHAPVKGATGDRLNSIIYFNENLKRKKSINLLHGHKNIKGAHTHEGYLHDENGTHRLTTKERRMVARVTKIWYNLNSK